MAANGDSYDVSAKYYDAAYAKFAEQQKLVDAGFYLELARQSGGPVLEIACGTGRILLSVARAGIAIEGVDHSAAMLGILRKHLAAEPADVRGRVKLHAGDMRDFWLGRKFPLVMIPFRPMQHMYTQDDQVAALRTAAAHLDEGGLLAFDVFFPKFEMIAAGIGEERLEVEFHPGADSSRVVRRYFRKEAHDKIAQNFSAIFLFRTYDGENLVSEESEPLKMSYYTYPQILALFKLAGVEIVEEYGSFEKTPLDNDAESMIFVLRKTASRT